MALAVSGWRTGWRGARGIQVEERLLDVPVHGLTIRTVLADDEKLTREEFGYLLAGVVDVEVVGEAGSGLDPFDLIEKERPYLALVAATSPTAGSGLAGMRRCSSCSRGL
jgi:hypothetical protein